MGIHNLFQQVQFNAEIDHYTMLYIFDTHDSHIRFKHIQLKLMIKYNTFEIGVN